MKQIWSYHLAILKWDKNLIAKACSTAKDENTKYIIIVAINIYGMSINNLDIRLVI